MIEQTSAKIFLSTECGYNESAAFRSYSTFNFGKYFNSDKEAFGALYVLNDDTIAEGCSAKMVTDRDCYIIFIPLVGGIDYSDSMGNSFYIGAGEAFMLHAPRGLVVSLTNPYEDAMVNYLHLRLLTKEHAHSKRPFKSEIDLDGQKNSFVEIISSKVCESPAMPFSLSLAKFDGRTDALYKLRDARCGLYAYVIQGAFELQYRLLQPGDGLALWGIEKVEAEALSRDAILLVAELYELA